MRIEATLECFCSCLYSLNDILVAKAVLQRLLMWKWILNVNWAKIFRILENKVRPLLHLQRLSDSHPSSVYKFSRDNPLHVPVITGEGQITSQNGVRDFCDFEIT